MLKIIPENYLKEVIKSVHKFNFKDLILWHYLLIK